jgi:CheY-like chemotaxis protein
MSMVKRFLLVDDDTDDRELFSEALASVNPDITCDLAADAQEALEKLYDNEDTPDVIFLDINLPAMTGWQFLRNLKSTEVYKDIPVIMYSTSNNQRDKDIARDLGALCFITKPNAFGKLKSTLAIIITYMDRQWHGQISTAVNDLRS